MEFAGRSQSQQEWKDIGFSTYRFVILHFASLCISKGKDHTVTNNNWRAEGVEVQLYPS